MHDKPTIDGRTLRRTGRTAQIATKVRPEYKAMVYELASTCGLPINEIIEMSIATTYREKLGQGDTTEIEVNSNYLTEVPQ